MQGVPIWLKKFLLGPIVKLSSLCSFHVACSLIHFEHVFGSELASGIKEVKICVDLHVICMLRTAVRNRIRGWFYLSRGKEKRRESDHNQ